MIENEILNGKELESEIEENNIISTRAKNITWFIKNKRYITYFKT
jgi:hypothetical protein